MPLLSVRDLQVDFTTRNGRVTAVNRIGFDVEAGKITADEAAEKLAEAICCS